MDLNDVTLDDKALEEGRWFHYDDETKFKILKAGSKPIKDAYKRINKKFAAAQAMNNEEMLRKLLAIVYAEMCVGWEGLTENGKELPYSKDDALRLFSNKSLSVLLENIILFSNNAENYFTFDTTDVTPFDEEVIEESVKK